MGLVSERHLGDVRHDVAEVFGRVLSNPASGVRAHRVEVAQRDDVPPLPEEVQFTEDWRLVEQPTNWATELLRLVEVELR